MSNEQKCFVLQRTKNLQEIAAWPNSAVPIAAQVNELIPELCKVPYDYLYRDSGSAMAECTALVWEYTGIDSFRGTNLDVYNFEAESTGAKINFYKGHIPDVDRNHFFIQSEDDLDKIRFNGLESGRIPYLIEFSKRQNELCGLEQFPAFCAPWSLACNLYGYENVVMDAVGDPEFLHELFRRIVDDLSAPMILALADAIPGCAAVSLVDAWASPPMVSVDMIEEFVDPYLKRLSEKLGGIPVRDAGVWGISKLNENDQKRFIQFLLRNGSLSVYDPDVEALTPEYCRKLATENNSMLLLGYSTSHLESASLVEIVEQVKRYVLAGKKGPTPLLFFLNNIGPFTPVEKIHTAVAAARTYGAQGADENTPFLMPEFMSFEEFLKQKIQNNTEGYTFDWLKKSGYAYLAK